MSSAVNPYISQTASIFKEGAEAGYYIKRTNGKPWQWVCALLTILPDLHD
jgi:alpha-glucosidase (family GH31 glycosyl hydrolase)